MDLAQTIALSAGLAWASGLRLYLVVFLAGVLAQLGYLHLPSTLAVLQHPLVIGVSGVMAFAELIADKVPASSGDFRGNRRHSSTSATPGAGHNATKANTHAGAQRQPGAACVALMCPPACFRSAFRTAPRSSPASPAIGMPAAS